MHLVQGTLDSPAILLTSTAGILAFGAACSRARGELSARRCLPLFGLSAFVFFAQALNVATGFGFSAHLVGAALLAILFGPCLAMLSMGGILILQVPLLGDGALSTLGANFLTMGVVAPWSACAVYRFMQGRRAPQGDVGQVVAVAASSFVSIFATSMCLNALLGSGYGSLLLSTAGVWAILETVISVAVFGFCVRSNNTLNADYIPLKPVALLCLLVLCLLPLSSRQSDGLEYSIALVEAK